uniref:Transposase_23 domain-containing protein n=1 Tax=Syphacia muris TaxID=451379 RepID=A0A0N5B1H4_9BILA
LWRKKCDWDDLIPDERIDKQIWNRALKRWKSDQIVIPRFVPIADSENQQIITHWPNFTNPSDKQRSRVVMLASKNHSNKERIIDFDGIVRRINEKNISSFEIKRSAEVMLIKEAQKDLTREEIKKWDLILDEDGIWRMEEPELVASCVKDQTAKLDEEGKGSDSRIKEIDKTKVKWSSIGSAMQGGINTYHNTLWNVVLRLSGSWGRSAICPRTWGIDVQRDSLYRFASNIVFRDVIPGPTQIQTTTISGAVDNERHCSGSQYSDAYESESAPLPEKEKVPEMYTTFLNIPKSTD